MKELTSGELLAVINHHAKALEQFTSGNWVARVSSRIEMRIHAARVRSALDQLPDIYFSPTKLSKRKARR